MPWAHNRHVDALTTLVSNIDIHSEASDVMIIRKTLRALQQLDPYYYYWRARLPCSYHLESDAAIFNFGRKRLKELWYCYGKLYFQDGGGL